LLRGGALELPGFPRRQPLAPSARFPSVGPPRSTCLCSSSSEWALSRRCLPTNSAGVRAMPPRSGRPTGAASRSPWIATLPPGWRRSTVGYSAARGLSFRAARALQGRAGADAGWCIGAPRGFVQAPTRGGTSDGAPRNVAGGGILRRDSIGRPPRCLESARKIYRVSRRQLTSAQNLAPLTLECPSADRPSRIVSPPATSRGKPRTPG
jgi:hypothetical protein